MIETQTAMEKPGPGMCRKCGSLLYQGGWRTRDSTVESNDYNCPACASTHDRPPAGHAHLRGTFLHNNRRQIIDLARHVESREMHEAPMKKILSILDTGDELQIATADMHLAWSIGDAIQHAWQGKLDYSYSLANNTLQVNWQR